MNGTKVITFVQSSWDTLGHIVTLHVDKWCTYDTFNLKRKEIKNKLDNLNLDKVCYLNKASWYTYKFKP